MPIIRMPSKRLVEVLGWDLIEEIDNYLEDAAEQIRAERRRLDATHHQRLVAPGRDADVLGRISDLEYHLRDESSRANARLRREVRALRDDLSGLQVPGHHAHTHQADLRPPSP